MIAALLAAAAFSMASADTNSLLEFFGFGKATPTPTPEPIVEIQSQKMADETDLPEEYPFENIDPALLEPDEDSLEAKNSDSWFTDDWEDDPYAYSSSADHYDEDPEAVGQKSPGGEWSRNNNSGRNNRKWKPSPTPTRPCYRFDNQVFWPLHRLPCTGFPTTRSVDIRESVQYAPTNMSLSIPALDISEDIVIVPLVDNDFPVANLGNNIGLLEGSGPSEDDLFVLAGHNHLNNTEKGPFAGLSAMKVSDLIFIRGEKNANRTFVVYANEKFAEDDIEGLLSYARPGCMILITCEDESIEGGYLNRRVVFAEAKTN